MDVYFRTLRDKKILLIEDDECVRSALSLLFDFNNINSVAVENGTEGIDLFLTEDFDIVIADYHLPDSDGIEVLLTLKTIKPTILTMLITGFVEPDLPERIQQTGIHDFIPKPFTPSIVVQALCRLVARYAAPAAPAACHA
jgi:CheY-like chemotaxis protein